MRIGVKANGKRIDELSVWDRARMLLACVTPEGRAALERAIRVEIRERALDAVREMVRKQGATR